MGLARADEASGSRGSSKDAMALFHDFTGEAPRIEPLLQCRGLDGSVD